MSRKYAIFALSAIALSACGGSGSSTSNQGGTSSAPPFSSESSIFDPFGPIGGDSEEDKDEVELEDNADPYALKEVEKNGSLSYEIFPRSFYDGDGSEDGIGDLKGITQKVGYLKSLGVGRVWLMPINPSPSYHGYDVTNYYDIAYDYGNMADFENMMKAFQEAGIEVMLDLVINHTSKEHSWFKQSAIDFQQGKTGKGSKADWYMWSSEYRGGTYKQYGSTGCYYECDFGADMPDLNLDNEEVRAEIVSIMKFWLSKGVKGFRLDAVKYYYNTVVASNVSFCDFLKDSLKDSYPTAEFVGEAYEDVETSFYPYWKSKLDSFFSFPTSITGMGKATIITTAKGFASGDDFSSQIASEEKKIKENGSSHYSSYFLSNHDQNRPAGLSIDGYSAKLASSLAYLLPGTPYMYYGEEIGLKGVRGNEPTDVMRRLPMIWDKNNKEGETLCPDPSYDSEYEKFDQVKEGVMDLLKDKTSLLRHYQKVANVRNRISFFKEATYEAVKTNVHDLLAYKISNGVKSYLIITNIGAYSRLFTLPSGVKGIFDSIDTACKKPVIKDGKLGLGAYSTAVLSL